MSHNALGTRYDDQIIAGLKRGLSVTALSTVIAPGHFTIRKRVKALGLDDLARQNGERAFKARTANSRGWSHIGLAIAHPRAVDPRPGKLSRAVRFARIDDRDVCVDADHIVACLHEGGLTLPEIEQATGVRPMKAVAAIRRFSECSA